MICFSLAVLSVADCALTGRGRTGAGVLFTSTTEPISEVQGANGARRGQACAINIMGLVSVGDASVESASKSVGISIISSVDADYFNVLLLFGRYCTIVFGR